MTLQKKCLFVIVFAMITIFFGCYGGNVSNMQSTDLSTAIENDTVANVIVISGQSNASGFTYIESLEKKIPQGAFQKYSNGFSNVKIFYNVDTIEENGYTWPTIGNNTSKGKFETVKLGQGHTTERFGPEIGIAERFNEQNSNDTLYIIKCSWGSASLYNDFASPSMDNYATSVYYDKLISVVKEGLKELSEITDKPIELRALCWIQGEKDSAVKSNAMNYGPNLQKFVTDFRNEFAEKSGGKEISFIDAELGLNEKWTHGDIVNQHKSWFSLQGNSNYTVSTLGLKYNEEPEGNPDLYHFDSLSMIDLGRRFANVLLKIL